MEILVEDSVEARSSFDLVAQVIEADQQRWLAPLEDAAQEAQEVPNELLVRVGLVAGMPKVGKQVRCAIGPARRRAMPL